MIDVTDDSQVLIGAAVQKGDKASADDTLELLERSAVLVSKLAAEVSPTRGPLAISTFGVLLIAGTVISEVVIGRLAEVEYIATLVVGLILALAGPVVLGRISADAQRTVGDVVRSSSMGSLEWRGPTRARNDGAETSS